MEHIFPISCLLSLLLFVQFVECHFYTSREPNILENLDFLSLRADLSTRLNVQPLHEGAKDPDKLWALLGKSGYFLILNIVLKWYPRRAPWAILFFIQIGFIFLLIYLHIWRCPFDWNVDCWISKWLHLSDSPVNDLHWHVRQVAYFLEFVSGDVSGWVTELTEGIMEVCQCYLRLSFLFLVCRSLSFGEALNPTIMFMFWRL